ncbi:MULTISPECIES: HigA family addiction module antitoxin [spotted fever group]|uniref:Putative HTH-type transcriptional regulator ybaQ n=1 Tax=Rickettsia tamurae subsp. buchneri TaxID=1462938 RepID=A0A8E0WKF0_9RICK|nr:MULTISPECIES: HigA family addiction module antitoxin [spotted fever group]EER20959.1 addiction module antidote protein, HigA family [Rickettsia endosymbiont of Ixodes scapularis]KDO02295.1 putative HTH-type transcriptional regulator ybaQ [Rickettsia tamurae subsp. buchneri]KDO02466.1 putative HTH-type transcriptional regulator ybaQ [Rickettsia tamurae subsp. buchneri]
MHQLLDLVTPGEVLEEEFMKPLNISQNRLARDIDVPPSRIHAIVHGRRSITADMALRLGKYFQTSAQMWINLQSHYDLEVAERNEWSHIKHRIRTMEVARKTS